MRPMTTMPWRRSGPRPRILNKVGQFTWGALASGPRPSAMARATAIMAPNACL